MYRRPKFLETLLEIRREMAREADYDVDLFAEMARSGRRLTTTDESGEAETELTPPPNSPNGKVQPGSSR